MKFYIPIYSEIKPLIKYKGRLLQDNNSSGAIWELFKTAQEAMDRMEEFFNVKMVWEQDAFNPSYPNEEFYHGHIPGQHGFYNVMSIEVK